MTVFPFAGLRHLVWPRRSRAPFHPATRKLLTARFLRSISQGALLVGFALYLDRLGWSAEHIGMLLGLGGLGVGLLSLLVGVTTDRWGRRSFLLGYQATVVAVSLMLVFTENPVAILLATLIGGFGRGQAGSAGPFAPAEGAWLAEAVQPADRGAVFSLNAGLGFFGMALGAALAGVIPLLQHWWPGALAYRALFALSALGALAVLLLLLTTPGGRGSNAAERARNAAAGQLDRRAQNRALYLLMFTNAFNGVAIGLTSPLIAYWFDLKFGVGPGGLGPVFAITFILTGLAAFATGALTRAFGIVRSVVVGRGLGLGLLLLLPVLPSYGLAAAVYALRSAVSRGTVGARQALAVSLVDDSRRGLATSVNAVSMIVPATIGPVLAGFMLQGGHLEMPFFLAAALQLVYMVLYVRNFRGYEPKQTESKVRGKV
jgi:MFS family permease